MASMQIVRNSLHMKPKHPSDGNHYKSDEVVRRFARFRFRQTRSRSGHVGSYAGLSPQPLQANSDIFLRPQALQDDIQIKAFGFGRDV